VTVAIKICGLTDAKAVSTAVDAGADFLGFNFFRRSPRFVSVEAAEELASVVPRKVIVVGLFVDPPDAQIESTLKTMRLDMIQLHGKETSARVAMIHKNFGVPVMKAVGIETHADVVAASAYQTSAAWMLFDAKPAPNAARPGGNALPFEWALMRAYSAKLPWMLAGGLTAKNVAAAIKASGARAVDVSSGVETSPGVKSPAKIRAFIRAVRAVAPNGAQGAVNKR
jgi:phosphoribosylanthranilate isomerase